jgi:Tol biopolymer transport system component
MTCGARGVTVVRMSTKRVALITALLTIALTSTARAASEPTLILYDDNDGNVLTTHFGSGKTDGVFYAAHAGKFGGGAVGPAWSPDGHTVALVAEDPADGSVSIIVTNRSGHVIATPLQAPQGVVGSLSWSPDGKQIAYECPRGVRDAPSDLCVVDVATGAHRLLAASTQELAMPYGGSRVSWSPRGGVILVGVGHSIACDDGNAHDCRQGEMALVDVASGALSLFTNHSAGAGVYSPDGTKILYDDGSSKQGEPTGLVVMSAEGENPRQIDPEPGYAPNWSPDGKQVVFSSRIGANNGNFDIWAEDADAGPRTRVTNNPDDSISAAWAPPDTICTVPKLKGKTLKKARELIKQAGCVLGKVTGPKKHRDKRHVVKQDPSPNHNVHAGTKVNVKVH